jgi:predicted RNA-binding protein with PIN domain
MASPAPSPAPTPKQQRIFVYGALVVAAIYVYAQKREGERIERSIRETYAAHERGRKTIEKALDTFRKLAREL